MKIEKYIFHYQKANDLYSRKYGSPRALNFAELFCIYSIKHLNTPRIATIVAHAAQCHHQISYTYVKHSLKHLINVGFVTRESMIYSLAPAGRDFLYSVRRYLLHKRL
jgi:hypothetical protein